MKRPEAIEICLEHVECEDQDDFFNKLISDSIRNVAICLGCEECFDIEPDASKGPSPCCEGKRYVTLTYLYGPK